MTILSRPEVRAFALGSAALALIAAMQAGAYLNHDVAWFSWGAGRLIGGKVLGRDILEPNFPLAYLIYAPALLFSKSIGLSASVKLWLLAIAAISAFLTFVRATPDVRTPITIALLVYVALGFPADFAQREEIALLLVAPYCVPPSQGRFPVLTGILAGVGFAIKPHFLIALAFVEFRSKLFRTEQLALVATGVLYAVVLLAFFRPFLFDMLPLTASVYGGYDKLEDAMHAVLPMLLSLSILIVSSRTDITARKLAFAALGFAIAGAAQLKFYIYHFLPAGGFLAMAFASLLVSRERMSRLLGFGGVGTMLALAAGNILVWQVQGARRDRITDQFVALLDRYPTFASFGVHPYPAFPTALYTSSIYLGVSNSEWFLPAASSGNHLARAYAVGQFRTELSRRPAVVIVDTDWRRHTSLDLGWDGLAFLLKDPQARSGWSRYKLARRMNEFEVFVRDPGASADTAPPNFSSIHKQ